MDTNISSQRVHDGESHPQKYFNIPQVLLDKPGMQAGQPKGSQKRVPSAGLCQGNAVVAALRLLFLRSGDLEGQRLRVTDASGGGRNGQRRGAGWRAGIAIA